MKRIVLVLGSLMLALLYCLAIGVASKSLIQYDIQNAQNPEQAAYFSTVTANLFSNTPPSEGSGYNLNDFFASRHKIQFHGFQASVKSTEQLSDASFVQYVCFSRDFLIHHYKGDILFPFHYFW